MGETKFNHDFKPEGKALDACRKVAFMDGCPHVPEPALIVGIKSEDLGFPPGLKEARLPWPDCRRIVFDPVNYGVISIGGES